MNDNLGVKAGGINYLKGISFQGLTYSTFIDVKTKFASIMLVHMSEGMYMDD
jgi:hypothetical protein